MMDFKETAKQIHKLRLEAHNHRQIAYQLESEADKLDREYTRAQRSAYIVNRAVAEMSDAQAAAMLTRLKARLRS